MQRILLLLIGLFAISFLVYRFFHKTYISFELVYKVPDSSKEFRPLGYEFFHTKQELESYFRRNDRTKELKEKLSDIAFDFDQYSYCIFYGREVTSMSYSYKTTYVDDITPTYARPKGKVPVFVTYNEDSNSRKGVFLYKVNKDNKLRGFYD